MPGMNNQHGMHPDDQKLVNSVLRGNTRDFSIIVQNTEAMVAQIVFRMIPVMEDRRDLVQEIYMKVFDKLSGFRFQSKLSTWIGQVAYNSCLTWLEKKKPVPESRFVMHGAEEEVNTLDALSFRSVDIHEREAEIVLSRKEISGILQSEIERLPPTYRTLIILFHQEEMSYDEMAEITQLPEGTVKSYLFRARKMLKENLLLKYKREAL